MSYGLEGRAMQKFMKSMELDYTKTVFGNPQDFGRERIRSRKAEGT